MTDPVDVSKLDPATLAKHLAKPEGPIGIAVTAGLNKTNARPYSVAIEKLRLQQDEKILEVGFGNGNEVGRLIDCATGIKYTGIDYSQTMVAEALTRNAAAIGAGSVVITHGTSDDLPFESAYFDAALALNTIYFWPHPEIDLREIRRVLKLGGRLAIGALSPWSAKERPVFQHGFAFYDLPELAALLSRAGFASTESEMIKDETTTPDGKKLIRDYFVVLAQA